AARAAARRRARRRRGRGRRVSRSGGDRRRRSRLLLLLGEREHGAVVAVVDLRRLMRLVVRQVQAARSLQRARERRHRERAVRPRRERRRPRGRADEHRVQALLVREDVDAVELGRRAGELLLPSEKTSATVPRSLIGPPCGGAFVELYTGLHGPTCETGILLFRWL